MTKNNRQFREFLRYEVSLNQDQLHRLQVSVRDVNRHLKGNLPGYQGIDRQGSYGLDALVKPVNEDDEYDSDIQVVATPNPNWKARDYLDAVSATLSQENNYADKIAFSNRCVSLNYAGDFRLDVVPRVTRQEAHFICNREKNCFEETNGTVYRDWFAGKSRITRAHLKAGD